MSCDTATSKPIAGASKKYIIALDQGTTSSRALLVDHESSICAVVQNEFPQIYPQPGWVEHDPREILSSQLGALTELVVSNNLGPEDIEAIGITNQRETTIIWNRETGEPIYNAIVWQCRRTAPQMDLMRDDKQASDLIAQKTGLVPDPYFSASKIAWILDNVEGARDLAEEGKLAFGTVDTWLIWALTRGTVHATDPTNASRTMLFDIHAGEWDQELLDMFGIPASMMPEVRPSAGFFGETSNPGVIQGVPIMGVAGDQQAALFGQCCFDSGNAKCTYGTGCFLLMHTGTAAIRSKNGLITTIAASAPGKSQLEYALEGSVFMGGALAQWLRDELRMIDDASETEAIALSVKDTNGIYIVPAFTGLGAPYWDPDARGAIFGLTRGAGRPHVVRAALEAIAYQVLDLVKAMEADASIVLAQLHVDGGASANDFLMQFQSDIMDRRLVRPQTTEATALGASYLAGLASGFWKDVSELDSMHADADEFVSRIPSERRHVLIDGWREAVARTRTHD